MTEEVIDFSARDLGGPKHASPSQTSSSETELTNELIKRKAWSRKFALVAVLVMSASALGCLGFAMYVGCHFLAAIEKQAEYNKAHTAIPFKDAVATKQESSLSKAGAKAGNKTSLPASSEKAEPAAVDNSSEKLYLSVLAPLIPASFSSALAVILFITIARFVTNFERIGKEDSEKDAPEDYGAIAALVQEVGKLIQTLRGK